MSKGFAYPKDDNGDPIQVLPIKELKPNLSTSDTSASVLIGSGKLVTIVCQENFYFKTGAEGDAAVSASNGMWWPANVPLPILMDTTHIFYIRQTTNGQLGVMLHG
jgi:hypothetical protein